jgi:hypothetical protein
MPDQRLSAAPLTVRIKKKTDGDAALSCLRADGSVTWQRQEGKLGAFFPLHDLTHFAVESVLELRDAFFGSIAGGWDISDFSGEGNLRRVSADALLAETLVGFFDLERMTGMIDDARGINAKLVAHYAERKLPEPQFRITDEQVRGVHAMRAELFAKWNAVPRGETLELHFR